MCPNEEKESWHYLVAKKLFTLLRGITPKHHGYFYCLNCLHSFRTENEKICKHKDFCGILMRSEKDNILEFNQYMKSDVVPCVICADTESLIKKKDGCANNPGNPLIAKIGEHIPCGNLMSTI